MRLAGGLESLCAGTGKLLGHGFTKVLIPTGRVLGVDRRLQAWIRRARNTCARPEPVSRTPRPHELLATGSWEYRELLKSIATTPVVGGLVFTVMKKCGWESYEESRLLETGAVNTLLRAADRTCLHSSLKELRGEMAYGRIGNLKISRIFLGGNLIGGWAHAGDLVYVSKLIKSYHSDEKVFDTLKLAEACGINTLLTNPILCRVINDYWRKCCGRIQFISDCAPGDDLMEGIRVSIDGGAHACYVQGAVADDLVSRRKVEQIGRGIDLIRRNGLPAGIGAHQLETVQTCVEAGLHPDFWVKTLHRCNGSSTRPAPKPANTWCVRPQETIEYMSALEEPWIAFKILGAGAIGPRAGFRYAFENGADFICVGMYDFQIVDDVNWACEILAGDLARARDWRG